LLSAIIIENFPSLLPDQACDAEMAREEKSGFLYEFQLPRQVEVGMATA